MKSAPIATDWRAVEREDGSIYLTCGGADKPYHMAFDTALHADNGDDKEIATRFAAAMNRYNQGV